MVACDGLVLAGGQSRRMGTSKDLLELSLHVTLLDCAVATLEAITKGSIWISRPYGYLPTEFHDVPDSIPDRGPLQGILEAFLRSSEDVLAVLAVDLPAVPPALYEHLDEAWRKTPHYDVVYGYSSDGDRQPLAAFWHRRSLGALYKASAADTVPRVQSVLKDLNILKVEIQPSWIANINTRDQWLAYQSERKL